MQKVWRISGISVVWGTLIIGCVMMGSSCAKKIYVPVERVRFERDTLAVIKSRVDTILERDTVRIEQRGDTVLVREVRWRERVRMHSDTVYKSKTDSVSIPVPVEVEKPVEVERPQTFWQKLSGTIGSVVIIFALTLFLIRLLRKKYIR